MWFDGTVYLSACEREEEKKAVTTVPLLSLSSLSLSSLSLSLSLFSLVKATEKTLLRERYREKYHGYKKKPFAATSVNDSKGRYAKSLRPRRAAVYVLPPHPALRTMLEILCWLIYFLSCGFVDWRDHQDDKEHGDLEDQLLHAPSERTGEELDGLLRAAQSKPRLPKRPNTNNILGLGKLAKKEIEKP